MSCLQTYFKDAEKKNYKLLTFVFSITYCQTLRESLLTNPKKTEHDFVHFPNEPGSERNVHAEQTIKIK